MEAITSIYRSYLPLLLSVASRYDNDRCLLVSTAHTHTTHSVNHQHTVTRSTHTHRLRARSYTVRITLLAQSLYPRKIAVGLAVHIRMRPARFFYL